MRRTIMLVGVLLTVVATSGVPSALADPPGGRVVANFVQGSARVHISAAGDPTSEAASGFVTNRFNPHNLFYEMRVTCMLVEGGHAVIGGEIIASDPFPGHVGSGLVVEVVDVAEPGRGADMSGHFFNSEPQPLPGTDCPAPTVLGPAFVIDAGNIQVLEG